MDLKLFERHLVVMPMRAKDIIDSLCEVDQSRRGFLKRLGTIAGGLAVSPATVASATSPKLLVVAPPEMWNYGSPTGLPHSDDYSEVFDLATQTTPLEGNVAKFFADKGYGFTASGQLVLTPEKAKRVSQLADIIGGHNVDQNTWNAIHSWPLETRHEHPLLQQIYAEGDKARRELQSFDDSILSSYEQAFGKKMEYTQDTLDRSEAWAKRVNDYNKKWHEDRRRADAEKKKEQDSLKYSRMDYAGGSEDVQGVDYTTQESVSRILGEANDALQAFLNLVKDLRDFDEYGSDATDFASLKIDVENQWNDLPLSVKNDENLEIAVENYLNFLDFATGLSDEFEREDFIEEEFHIPLDLLHDLLRAIKSGLFNNDRGLLGGVLSGDPFGEANQFTEITPENRPYLEQIAKMFDFKYSSPEDVIKDLNLG
jgi:hypothetical protein